MIPTTRTKQPQQRQIPMNNTIIRIQMAAIEVAYLKILYINPVLAEVDVEFYHSLPLV